MLHFGRVLAGLPALIAIAVVAARAGPGLEAPRSASAMVRPSAQVRSAAPRDAGGANNSTLARYAPGEVVITADTAAGGAFAALAGVPDVQVERVGRRARYITVKVPAGREEEYRQRLAALPSVTAAELNPLWQPAMIPNDASYGLQWDLPMIQADAAWDVAQGQGSTVAVLDTGVAFENYLVYKRAPDLFFTRFVHPRDILHGNSHPNDETGHGTHVTGTIAEDTNNFLGEAGIAPLARIMPVKVCSTAGCPGDVIAEGIHWAVDNGADVINMSIGGSTLSSPEREALLYAEDHGVVVVAAAGNGGGDFAGDPQFTYPAAYPTVVAVGSVRYDGSLAPYSNYGYGDAGYGLHIVAPGGDNGVDQNSDGYPDGILQNTYAFGCSADAPVDYSVFKDCRYEGTSMAAPHVSGVVALVHSRFPGLSPGQVRFLLACSARDLGTPGYDERFGAGIVQAYEALKDSDADGMPDCLESPPSLDIAIGTTVAGPGETVRVHVNGAARAPGIASYTMDVFFDPQVAQVTQCRPMAGATCTTPAPGRIELSGANPNGLSGTFRLADLDLRALGATGSASVLHPVLADAETVTASDLERVHLIDGLYTVRDLSTALSGDANCDGAVNSVDAVTILQDIAALGSAVCLRFGDANCSGDADSVDALAVLRHVAALQVALPAGCPAIGTPLGPSTD